jgi:hypothetical protein
MKRWVPVLPLFATALGVWAATVQPCGLDYTFRAYLDKRFWQPLSKYEESLGRSTTVEGRNKGAPFAGMSNEGSNEILQRARNAYMAEQFSDARTAVETGLKTNPSENEREELLLIDAKIDLREWEGARSELQDRYEKASGREAPETAESSDKELLHRAGTKLLEFIRTSQAPAFRSEARGWLARIYYLTKDYPSAAKIYLDELSKEDSVFSRESLVCSLRMLFPYNGSSSRLADHLEQYFDTPAHALFVVNLVTNPIYSNDEERASMAEVARKTIDALQKRRDLFNGGAESEALALALMRASLYMGDTQSALSYSQWISEKSETARKPEFNWMRAACSFLQHDYKAAEVPLLRMYHSEEANFRDKTVAAQALLGVYQKLGRGVDQLHAAFLYYQAEQERPPDSRGVETQFLTGPYYNFVYLPAGGWLFDLPYLLDVQLKNEDLSLYLKRYSKPAGLIRIESFDAYVPGRERSACEMVEYALAVRYTRQEKYWKAASIYQKLNAGHRANRMRHLARLHAEANDPSLSTEQRLEAQFAYAAFLEEHSTQVFFNDMLWHGFQRYAFLETGIGSRCTFSGYADCQGLTREERDRLLKQERRVKDDQEERWRAYKILELVIKEAGHSELGNRAAAKALKCLKLINTDRFGREQEVDSAIRHLSNWGRDMNSPVSKNRLWKAGTVSQKLFCNFGSRN